jgi:hypothetical protein
MVMDRVAARRLEHDVEHLARVIEEGDDELLEIDFDGEQLLLRGVPALRIRHLRPRRMCRHRRGRQPVKGDGEAELEGTALQRVQTGGGYSGAMFGTGDGHASTREAVWSDHASVLRRLQRERLLDGAEIRPHRHLPLLRLR